MVSVDAELREPVYDGGERIRRPQGNEEDDDGASRRPGHAHLVEVTAGEEGDYEEDDRGEDEAEHEGLAAR